MENQSVGFIGGGRVVRILLAALQRKYRLPEAIVVCDPKTDVLKSLQESFSKSNIRLEKENAEAA
ncbi:MAG: NAD(P)-binding domain-containing protein [bacterium]